VPRIGDRGKPDGDRAGASKKNLADAGHNFSDRERSLHAHGDG
jgi:hypothetical protein